MAFLPTKCSCKLLLAVALLGLASSHVLAFIALPGGSGVVGRSALLQGSGNVPPVFSRPLQRSPHDALEEKGLLVESLLEAKVSWLTGYLWADSVKHVSAVRSSTTKAYRKRRLHATRKRKKLRR